MADEEESAKARRTVRAFTRSQTVAEPAPVLLTEPELARGEQLNAWLADKWEDANCPYCGHDAWSIDPIARYLDRPSRRDSVPVYAVICKRCAVETLLNADRVGLWPDRPRREDR